MLLDIKLNGSLKCLKIDFHFPVSLFKFLNKCPSLRPLMEELFFSSCFVCLFLTWQTEVLDFLRNRLIVYSDVNVAWLLVSCGNPSQTRSCQHIKSQYTVLPYPVNKEPPHPSYLTPTSSHLRTCRLCSPLLFPSPLCILSLALLTQTPAPVPVLVLSSISDFFILFSFIHLSTHVLLITLCGTYINRRKEARKVVGSTGWMTLMRSLWLATQPKTN